MLLMSHRNVTFTSLVRGAALLAAWLLVQPAPARAQPGAGAPVADPRAGVAVQPFANLSGDAADAWIGAGIAASVFADLNAAGSAADPRWLVQGSYQRLGGRLRITAELVDPASAAVVGAARVDGELSALLALQDALADQLADALQAAHGPPARLAESRGAGRPAGAAAAGAGPLRAAPPAVPPGARVPPAPAPAPAGGGGAFAGLALNPSAGIDPPPPVPPAVVSRNAAGNMTMRAVRLDAPLQLDGRLDEEVYLTVPPITDFVQQEPDTGAVATERTEVWVMFDGETLYVGARCLVSEPGRVVANEMKRDSPGMFGNDSLAVILDTYYDRRNGFIFITNSLGGIFDATVTNERTPNLDWNTVWDVRTSRFEDGWTVELAIPFKSLRYRTGAAQLWGINMQRRAVWKNEQSFLTPIPAAFGMTGMFRVSMAATLTGLEVPSAGMPVELKPYAISDLTSDFAAATPFSNQLGGDAGVDLKLGVTQGLTADLTYNTDFAQVEVDERQVNLTRFSLFFPEKREFFLEGQGIFDFGGGQRPVPNRFFITGERFPVDAPILFFSRRIGLEGGQTVPITGGGRLTGKTGPFSLGLLNVQTGEAPAGDVAPTNFTVVRVKRDVLRRSSIGGMFTRRSLSTGGDGANQVYGVDGVFSFHEALNFNTYLARTDTPGLHDDNLSYRTELYYEGDRWGFTADHLRVGTNFNPEIGFVRRHGFRRNFGMFRFSPRPQGIDAVRKFTWEASVDHITDGAGRMETRLQRGQFVTELETGDLLFALATDNYEYLVEPFQIATDVTIPVGGYSFMNYRAGYSLARQRGISGGIALDFGRFYGGEKTTLSYYQGRLTLTPQLTLEPNISLHWIDLPEGSFTTELVSTRVTYTVTPRMFVAALLQYNSADNAIGSNVRFRWEYQPGSELFVVYTDERDTLNPRPFLLNRAFVVKLTRLFRF